MFAIRLMFNASYSILVLSPLFPNAVTKRLFGLYVLTEVLQWENSVKNSRQEPGGRTEAKTMECHCYWLAPCYSMQDHPPRSGSAQTVPSHIN